MKEIDLAPFGGLKIQDCLVWCYGWHDEGVRDHVTRLRGQALVGAPSGIL